MVEIFSGCGGLAEGNDFGVDNPSDLDDSLLAADGDLDNALDDLGESEPDAVADLLIMIGDDSLAVVADLEIGDLGTFGDLGDFGQSDDLLDG